MARPVACCNPCQKPPSASEDELADVDPTEGNGTPTPTPVVSHAPTPAPATATGAAPSLDTEVFKQFMKAYLEAQMPSRTEIDSEP